MKILLVGPSFPYRGGISHYTTLLYRKLIEKNEIKIITFSRLYPDFLFFGRNQLDESQERIAAPAERLIDSINPLSWLKAFQNIMIFQPQLVIFQWWHPFFAPCYFTLAALTRLFTTSRIIFICHNIYGHESFPLKGWLTKLSFSPAHAFLVHSQSDGARLKQIMPVQKIFSSLHPTYEVFRFQRLSTQEAKRILGWSDRSILFFGLIRDYKGVSYLIKAMVKVLEKIDCQLYIVGEIYQRKEEYLELIKKNRLEPHVTMIDRYIPNEEVQLFFSASDIVVLPYLSASQSGVIQIAYAFNKPVISTRVGGLEDVVEDGRTGYLVNHADEKALAEAMLRFFRHRDPASFVQNIEASKGKFSWDKLTHLLEIMATKP